MAAQTTRTRSHGHRIPRRFTGHHWDGKKPTRCPYRARDHGLSRHNMSDGRQAQAQGPGNLRRSGRTSVPGGLIDGRSRASRHGFRGGKVRQAEAKGLDVDVRRARTDVRASSLTSPRSRSIKRVPPRASDLPNLPSFPQSDAPFRRGGGLALSEFRMKEKNEESHRDSSSCSAHRQRTRHRTSVKLLETARLNIMQLHARTLNATPQRQGRTDLIIPFAYHRVRRPQLHLRHTKTRHGLDPCSRGPPRSEGSGEPTNKEQGRPSLDEFC